MTTNAKVVSSSRAGAKKKDESQASINERGPVVAVAAVVAALWLRLRLPVCLPDPVQEHSAWQAAHPP